MSGRTYRQAGVDYAILDAGKRRAVKAALETSPQIKKRGAKRTTPLGASRRSSSEPAIKRSRW